MNNSNTVTCSFTMDRDLYNQYKSIIVKDGKNVKGDLIRYMQQVIAHEVPNDDTLEALKEVKMIKANPENYKSYNSFEEILAELDNNEQI